ncbi:MAG: DUF4332 domain-containing protein [Luteolibacter sp.]
MTNLRSIPGIGKTAFELLEAAGFLDVESLAKAGADELVTELERANQILQIAKRSPVRGNVEKWIAIARDLIGAEEDPGADILMPVNYEQSPQVAVMLSTAPFAIPLPARQLVERGLAVPDIPAAIFLNRYSGDLEVKVDERIPKAPPNRSAAAKNIITMADTGQSRVDMDSTRIKSIEEVNGGPVKPIMKEAGEECERVALIRGPRLETNAGRDPQSSFYIRGVLHSHPLAMTFGAFITLLLVVWIPLAIIATTLLMVSDLKPEHLSWVPKWLLVFPCTLPLFGLAYLLVSAGRNCRICGQKMFVPRVCLKNPKAHYVRGIGYIVPACLHMLVFKWFRCTYCGTPVRLKK